MVRLLSGLACLAVATQTIQGVSIPDAHTDTLSQLSPNAPRSDYIVSPDHTLERRKGGGGRGSSGSSSSSSGSSSSGGSSGTGGSSRTSTTSSIGGSTRLGSGPSRSYGGGNYYGGGAAVPYQAGERKKGLGAGALIAPAAVLAIMPGLWLYSVYPYYYNNPYRFYNRSAIRNRTADNDNDRRDFVDVVIRQEQGANETLPVICLCGEDHVCSCEENTDQKYINDLVGDGDYAKLNKSLVTVSEVNGTKHLVLNGTLPRGTTAPGGVDDAATALGLGKYAGYWAMGLVVVYGVFL